MNITSQEEKKIMEDCENVYCIMHNINAGKSCYMTESAVEKFVETCATKQVYDSVENEKGQSGKSLSFPTLEQCLDHCLKSVTDKKLSLTVLTYDRNNVGVYRWKVKAK